MICPRNSSPRAPIDFGMQSPFLRSHPFLIDDERKNLLLECSERADSFRKSLVRGSKFLIVGGGVETDISLYQIMRGAGIKVFIMDTAGAIWNTDVYNGKVIDGFIECDIHQTDGIGKAARNALTKAGIAHDFFDAITSHHDEALYAAALVAEEFDLAINDSEAFRISTSKIRTRETMLKHRLPVPRFRLLTDLSGVSAGCDYVGFPAVIKLNDGNHSIGVYRVENLDQAKNAFELCLQASQRDFSTKRNSHVVLEQFLTGFEVDIDLIMSYGECVYAGVSDNWCQPPYFQDYGVHAPSICNPNQQSQMIDLAVRALQNIGFRNGSFHCEGKFSPEFGGPQLLEINARVGCKPMVPMHIAVWGVDLIMEHAYAALGIPCHPFAAKEPLVYSVGLSFNAPYSGTVNSSSWLDHFHGRTDIRMIRYEMKEGEAVTGPEKDVPSILGTIVIISTESRRDVNETARGILQNMKVPIAASGNVKVKPFFVPGKIFPFVQPSSESAV